MAKVELRVFLLTYLTPSTGVIACFYLAMCHVLGAILFDRAGIVRRKFLLRVEAANVWSDCFGQEEPHNK
jgi:hypothetical protein